MLCFDLSCWCQSHHSLWYVLWLKKKRCLGPSIHNNVEVKNLLQGSECLCGAHPFAMSQFLGKHDFKKGILILVHLRGVQHVINWLFWLVGFGEAGSSCHWSRIRKKQITSQWLGIHGQGLSGSHPTFQGHTLYEPLPVITFLLPSVSLPTGEPT